jgi:hypothetical protein
MASYLGQEPGQGQAERFLYTTTGTGTAVTADDDGLPIRYTVNQVSVYLNGVKQVIGSGKDVTATDGSTITFLSAYASGDVIEVIALSSFSAADSVPATGGTYTGQVTLPSPVINTAVSGSAVLDEDAMGSNSATKLATQQSIKAYADTKAPIAGPTFTGTVAGVTATHVGLGNVTNESKATMFATSTLTGVTTAASLVLTPGTAPGSPTEGQLYYNDTDNVVYVYNGSTWDQLSNIPVSATGGTVSTSSGYTYHTFTSSGSLVVVQGGSVEILTVGAGGGGGGYGGGGGGGAVLHSVGKILAPSTYTITINGGGTGRASNQTGTMTGGTTVAFSQTATGGGTGGAYNNVPGSDGANGGGAGAYGDNAGSTTTPGAGVVPSTDGYTTAYCGFSGGDCITTASNYPNGGGGGAAAVGVLGYINGGAGGAGKLISTMSAYYWGGGGGGSVYDTNGTGGVGGIGGGAGGTRAAGGAGLNNGATGGSVVTLGAAGGANTGGGGGGVTHTSGTGVGGSGGSGIVIIRYLVGLI